MSDSDGDRASGERVSVAAKQPWIDLFWEFDFASNEQPMRELFWLARHGDWSFGRNGCLTFGAGRFWYDGPHWFAHFGWWSVSLECR